MKTLGKLKINPEKVIKNEEMVNLKGGGYCECHIEWGGWTQDISGGCAMPNCNTCEQIMWNTYPYTEAYSIACE